MKYLVGTQELCLTLKSDKTSCLKWYVDAAFTVHSDFKSHTGATLTIGKGVIVYLSRNKKLNAKSRTEDELVGVDYASSLILWTKLFLVSQGYKLEQNILYQDSRSTILLQENGKKSSSKRTRHLNIRYFPSRINSKKEI